MGGEWWHNTARTETHLLFLALIAANPLLGHLVGLPAMLGRRQGNRLGIVTAEIGKQGGNGSLGIGVQVLIDQAVGCEGMPAEEVIPAGLLMLDEAQALGDSGSLVLWCAGDLVHAAP